jgi:predicted phosphate transport protein (TIGR00153 family)
MCIRQGDGRAGPGRIVANETLHAFGRRRHAGVVGAGGHGLGLLPDERQHGEETDDRPRNRDEPPISFLESQGGRIVQVSVISCQRVAAADHSLATDNWQLATHNCTMPPMDLKRVDKVFRVLPKEERYYELFDQLVGAVVEGCDGLHAYFSANVDAVASVAAIKAAERRGDDVTREILVSLNRSFVTPIDREDIQGLAKALDDILDDAYEAASFAEATGLSEHDEHLRFLADALEKCARALAGAIEHLNDRNGITEHCATVYHLEAEADMRYVAALRALFSGQPDPLRVVRLKDLYARIEGAIDRCNDAANILKSIVLKNS